MAFFLQFFSFLICFIHFLVFFSVFFPRGLAKFSCFLLQMFSCKLFFLGNLELFMHALLGVYLWVYFVLCNFPHTVPANFFCSRVVSSLWVPVDFAASRSAMPSWLICDFLNHSFFLHTRRCFALFLGIWEMYALLGVYLWVYFVQYNLSHPVLGIFSCSSFFCTRLVR